MQARQGHPQQAVESLAGLLPTLQELSPPPAVMHSLWLGLLASLAHPEPAHRKAFAEVQSLILAWQMGQGSGEADESAAVQSAELAGQVLALESTREAAGGCAAQVRGCVSHCLGLSRLPSVRCQNTWPEVPACMMPS